jgi:hypothetical protein
MLVPILIGVVLFLIVAALVLAIVLRRPQTGVPPTFPAEEGTESIARRQRQEVLDTRGSELIERRVELDARRGTLGGDAGLERALDELYHRLEAGEIGEQEFEVEKVRLLGGE